MSEQPFKINIQESKIHQLNAKLDATIFPDELENAGWKYGVPLADIKRLASRWRNGFDWKKQEKDINAALPQFTRDIEVANHGTLNIHYVHKKSESEAAVPLLFVHGWPGSFLEVGKILLLLTQVSSEYPSFHVVAFSLPGYAFSEAPKKQGFGPAQYAEIGNKLMLALGYNEYVTQGGDWGRMVTRKIANDYGGKHSKAWHTNYPKAEPPKFLQSPLQYLIHSVKPYTPAEKARIERFDRFSKEGRGYSILQETVPQTIGYSLADSPVGLLSWIYEKLVMWSGGYPWTDDEVLTWVSIYWFSRAGPAASLRIYYEASRQGGILDDAQVPTIPMGTSVFPKELSGVTRTWIRASDNVVFLAEHDKGGHFAAHEQPEALVGDLRKMFKKGGPAFGVVSGKNGYSAKL